MTQEEAMQGFNSGRTLVVDRKDEPLLPWLLQQVNAGVLTRELIQYDDQSSAMKFKRAKP